MGVSSIGAPGGVPISDEVHRDQGVPDFSTSSSAAAAEREQGGANASAELNALREALERLIQSRRALADEVERLRAELATRDQRVRTLEGEVRELLQTKRDVAKRIDDLIGQLDHFERDAAQSDSAAANV